MSFSTPELSFLEMLKLAGCLGYDGIEPRLDAKQAHGVEVGATPEQREGFKKASKDAGIAFACLATSLKYADPEQKEEMLKQTGERIDLAGDMGVPVMRVFGGKLGGGISRDKAVELVAECLKSVADHAGERGVTVCVETHDDWCDPSHVAAVMERVNHPAITVNWDVMHPVRTGNATMKEAFDILNPWIRHVHVHDAAAGTADLCPIGEGGYDHKTAIELLRGCGYDGFISGEWINWEPYEKHLPRELETLKNYEQSA